MRNSAYHLKLYCCMHYTIFLLTLVSAGCLYDYDYDYDYDDTMTAATVAVKQSREEERRNSSNNNSNNTTNQELERKSICACVAYTILSDEKQLFTPACIFYGCVCVFGCVCVHEMRVSVCLCVCEPLENQRIKH